jgi:LuxR family maltose regulon positive regulatory protein
MADVLDRRGRTAEAEVTALRGLELARRGRAQLETGWALLSLALIKFHAGNAGDARARLGAAREIIAACADPGVLTELTARTEGALAAGHRAASRVPSGLAEPLSEREQEILRWLNSRLSLREIASELFVSYYTVKTHTQHIYRKLGVSTREQAVRHTRGPDAPLTTDP